MCGCLLHTPYWGPGLQPRHVPWLGIKPVTLWFTGWCSIHWATPVRACLVDFKYVIYNILDILFYFNILDIINILGIIRSNVTCCLLYILYVYLYIINLCVYTCMCIYVYPHVYKWYETGRTRILNLVRSLILPSTI